MVIGQRYPLYDSDSYGSEWRIHAVIYNCGVMKLASESADSNARFEVVVISDCGNSGKMLTQNMWMMKPYFNIVKHLLLFISMQLCMLIPSHSQKELHRSICILYRVQSQSSPKLIAEIISYFPND